MVKAARPTRTASVDEDQEQEIAMKRRRKQRNRLMKRMMKRVDTMRPKTAMKSLQGECSPGPWREEEEVLVVKMGLDWLMMKLEMEKKRMTMTNRFYVQPVALLNDTIKS